MTFLKLLLERLCQGDAVQHEQDERSQEGSDAAFLASPPELRYRLAEMFQSVPGQNHGSYFVIFRVWSRFIPTLTVFGCHVTLSRVPSIGLYLFTLYTYA